MSEITKAIKARQTQITQLQSDIETLQRAAGLVGSRTKAPAKATSPPAKPQPKPKPKPKAKTKKRKRHQWSAAEKAAIGKRMKAYWAKRRAANSLNSLSANGCTILCGASVGSRFCSAT